MLCGARSRAAEPGLALLPVDYLNVEESKFDTEQAAAFEEAARRGAAHAGFLLIERDMVRTAAEKQGVQVERCVSLECLTRVGKGCNADAVLRAGVENEGALYTFVLTASPGVETERTSFSGPRSEALGYFETLVIDALKRSRQASNPAGGTAAPKPIEQPQGKHEEPETRLQEIFGYTLIGLGAASVVTGGVFVGMDGSCRHAGCDGNVTDPTVERWDSDVQGWVMVGVGAAAVGGGLFLLLYDGEKKQNASIGVSPSGSGAVFTYEKRF